MESTFLIGIVNNITLLLVLGFLYSVSIRRWDIRTIKGQCIAGLLFGLVAVIGMVVPVQYSPGLIYDGTAFCWEWSVCSAAVWRRQLPLS